MARTYMRRLSLASVALLFPTVWGCGLILGGGSRQTIQAVSSPDGAKVTTAPSTTTYTTPASLNLERKYGYTLTFEKAGYSPATFDIRTNVRAGYVVADVLLTGLVGVLVDALTGGWSKLTPETASVTLNKVAMIEGPDRIYVAIKTDVAHGTLQVQSSVPGIVVQVVPAR